MHTPGLPLPASTVLQALASWLAVSTGSGDAPGPRGGRAAPQPFRVLFIHPTNIYQAITVYHVPCRGIGQGR